MDLARSHRFAWALLSLLPIVSSGCGYHGAAAAVHLPRTVHLVDVPTFRNHTQAYHVELSMTQAVLRELTSRTPYHVASSEDPGEADAVIRGEITSF
ncbi:MAG TPA: LPS assembly lipoprotein LptE, partial [Acidobacteriaceae bacterium]